MTDHSQRVTIAHGLDAKRLARQLDQIDRVNGRLRGFKVLKGCEVDILGDGKLDLPDSILSELDIVIGAIHSKFDMPRAKQTDRLIRAMDNPHFNILAHPTGRLIGERAPYDIDMERLLEAARQRGCYLEVNAQPDRLDLNGEHCRMAKEFGVKLALSTDAHDTADLDLLRFAVDQARRGWIEPGDVLNARPLKDLKKLLKRG
jgi:DNA polymerase (family 10)